MLLSFIKINFTITSERVNSNLGVIHAFEQLTNDRICTVSLDSEDTVMSAESECV